MARSGVILGGQVLHGRDRFGDWRVNKLDGYFESPGTKGSTVDRENDDGEYDMPVNNTARFITVSGRVLCSGPAQVRHAANRLTGLLRSNTETLQVTDAGGTTWARVKRNGPTTPVKVNDRMLRFQFDLKAPDPRRFGDANVYTIAPNQTVPLFHYGNADSTPIFDITGDMPAGYTLWGPDSKTFVAPSTVSSTYPHHLDMGEGLLKIRGYYWTGHTGNADLWTIPPGQQVLTGLTSTGTGTAKVTVYDTYI